MKQNWFLDKQQSVELETKFHKWRKTTNTNIKVVRETLSSWLNENWLKIKTFTVKSNISGEYIDLTILAIQN